ncbi:RidA family protein [Pseudomonas sp. SZMC_28357]|uniref:RidA family protein n=1 Tax=Pseudomonas sp. SZMC_28357 TaxID=3074380 RepID=UPI002871E227|nr:RidA family protein [Pseudomonas sp. SZMC_28357]MDR9753782.1 RidA family protein [Pseudomonas sp. SZMC_28357]
MSSERVVLREGPFKRLINDGVTVGDWIYLSGQLSVDASGQTVGENDIAEQVRMAYQNVKTTLQGFGAEMHHVVEETLFVTDIRHFLSRADELFAIRAHAYGEEPQVAQTLVQVVALGVSTSMIEIKCVAKV